MEAPLIYKTIAQVMSDINAISKGRRNAQQGFQFRGIDDVMNELHEPMAKAGLFVVPSVLEENRTEGATKSGSKMFYVRLKIKFTFYAADGSNVESVVIGEAMDSGDKASNKALSIGLKYALLQVFCIPTEDDKDPDAEAHTMSQEAQKERDNWKAQKTAPAPKMVKASELKPKKKLAGGDATPAEAEEIRKLLSAVDNEKKPIFTKADAIKWSNMREDFTAAEVIEFLKQEIAKKVMAPADMSPETEAALDAIF